MKSVLFAIDHMTPDRKALDYALVLCRRMSATLEVLHIVHPPVSIARRDPRRTDSAGDRTGRAAGIGESAVDPVERLKAKAQDRFNVILPPMPETPIDYRCMVTDEAVNALIEGYVRRRHHIVLTVFDRRSHRVPPSGGVKSRGRPAGGPAMPKLSIPLVFVKDTH